MKFLAAIAIYVFSAGLAAADETGIARVTEGDIQRAR